MPGNMSLRRTSYRKNLTQSYTLIFFGIVCLLAAWQVHPNTAEYPIGVMVFGFGMLIASFINPYRLVVASFLTTALGISAFLFFKHLIAGNEVFPVYIIPIGIGLIGIALMARRG